MKTPGILVVALGLVLVTGTVHAQESLPAARDLYAAAQYDEALELLNRISPATFTSEDRQSLDLYRSLCLLALGRHDDAERAIEAIVTRDPLFRPGDDLPPRTRAAFSDARRRLLPEIVQQQYAEAKRTFDQGEFQGAAVAFGRVIAALDDPDTGTASTPSLADLRTLAAGFHDLSVKAITPPPAPPEPVATPAPAPAPTKIYAAEDGGVRPPVTIQQEVPKYAGPVPSNGFKGVVEVVIDKAGTVESVTMVVPVSSAYDKVLMTEAARWQFKPALLNGEPVKFRKRIQINVTPPVR